jgi:hypothetical protein
MEIKTVGRTPCGECLIEERDGWTAVLSLPGRERLSAFIVITRKAGNQRVITACGSLRSAEKFVFQEILMGTQIELIKPVSNYPAAYKEAFGRELDESAGWISDDQ